MLIKRVEKCFELRRLPPSYPFRQFSFPTWLTTLDTLFLLFQGCCIGYRLRSLHLPRSALRRPQAKCVPERGVSTGYEGLAWVPGGFREGGGEGWG